MSLPAGTETLITAVSVEASSPTSVALAVVPSWKRTEILVAPLTTWSAVTMSPLLVDDVPGALGLRLLGAASARNEG